MECYVVDSQLEYVNSRADSTSSSFHKSPQQLIVGYTKYNFKCESERKQTLRIFGFDAIYDKYIAIEESSFYKPNAYESGIVIFKSAKDLVKSFTNAFEKDCHYEFEQIEIDFNKIIDDQKQLGIQGIWLGKIPNEINVNAVALMGNQIENSQNYQDYILRGCTITNLSIIYDYNGDQELVMITKDGGVILYKHKDETEAIALVHHIYENLLKA